MSATSTTWKTAATWWGIGALTVLAYAISWLVGGFLTAAAAAYIAYKAGD
jgi:hypothetical protein